MLGGLGMLGLILGLPAQRAEAQNAQCWRSADLRVKQGEGLIRKGQRSAYVPLPTGTPRKPDASLQLVRGSIRRVALPPGKKVIALTFDLCEQPYEVAGYQGDIVDYLRKQKVPATFFAGGKWMLTHTDRAQQIMSDRLFELANHSWEHRNFRLLGARRIKSEIDGAQLAYERTYDALAKRHCLAPSNSKRSHSRLAHTLAPSRLSLFRFPFGACNAQALKAVNDRGLLAIQWDISSADPWKGQTVERMTRYILSRAKSGSIIIFHANGRGWRTGAALPGIIAGLKAKGFSFATVTQLLALPGARPIISKTCYDARKGDSNRYDDLSRRLEARYQKFYRSVGVAGQARKTN